MRGGNSGVGGQRGGGAIVGWGVNGGGGGEVSQPLRSALHTISISISLQNSLR